LSPTTTRLWPVTGGPRVFDQSPRVDLRW
jgi:hypothetical protein